MTANRKLAAILAADVAGYSRLMADDEPATLRTLHDFRKLFRERIEAHGGRLIDTAGDSVLAEFPSPVEAVACAAELQQQLARRNAQLAEHRRMPFRIGVNLGDVIEEDGGLYGDGVNVAARLQALAEPGGVCVSGTVFDQIEGKLPMRFKFIGEQQVKNIPKPVRTYRLVPETSADVQRQDRHRTAMIFALVALAIGVASAAGWFLVRPNLPGATGEQAASAQSGARPRLAVLPLDNFSASADDEYFSDGMTEELISRLSRLSGMDVIARTSVMQYKGTKKSIAEIGRELNVSAVLEGSVRKAADKVRITVQLIDVPTQGHLWSQDYDRDVGDIFATQSDISGEVAKALHVKLVRAPTATAARSGLDKEAYAFYLKGRFHAGKFTPDGLKKSIEYFEQALAKQPEDAHVWSALAWTYAMLGWWAYAPPSESFTKAKVAAEKALSFDETLPEAHIALGMVRFLYEWDWDGAGRAYRRAIELGPGNSYAHLFHGVLLKALTENDRAAAEIARANELDPLNLMANAEVGWVAYFGRRFQQAAQACQRTLEMDPNYMFALSCRQMALTLAGDPEAIALGKKMLELTSGDSYFLGQLGWAYGVLGQEGEARRILSELRERARKQDVPPPALFYVYLGLKDSDATLEYMELAYRGRWSDVVWIKSSPEFDWLRGDARFQALLKKMNLD